MCVCVCVCVCLRGLYEGLSRYGLVGGCVLPGENFFTLTLSHVCTLDSVTGNLAVNNVFITFISMRDTNRVSLFFHFFSFFETLSHVSLKNYIFSYKFTVSFTMVIKLSPGGESAGGWWSTSKSICLVPA